MTELKQTRHAIFELQSSEERGVGMHMGDELAIGVPGIPIGEVAFDSSRHLAEAINPFSVGEMMTGMPHVTQVMPFRHLEMNVVLHQDPADRRLHRWLQPVREHKRWLARQLFSAIDDSKQMLDQTNLYVVGDSEDIDDLPGIADIRRNTESADNASKEIAQICLQGLTFVISDFNNLPLGRLQAAYTQAIAVKVNHALELKIPANVGIFPLDGATDVDTRKAHKLKAANDGIQVKHSRIEDSLVESGFRLARAVYDPKSSVSDSLSATDENIAKAIRSFS